MLNQKDLVKELTVQEKEKAWLIKQTLNEKECNFIKNYFFLKKRVLDFRLANNFSKKTCERYGWGVYGDPQCSSNTYCNYGDVLNDLYLLKFLPLVQKYEKEKIYPTYTYMRIYNKGAILEKHKDRDECYISTTLFVSGKPWDIFIGNKKLSMLKGDMVIYKGSEVSHWREKFEGDYCLQIFFHYTKDKKRMFDGRPLPGIHKKFNIQDR